MKFLARLRRDRVAEVLDIHEKNERLIQAQDAERIVRSHCRPIRCDIKDNYVCAAHRHA